MDVANTIELPDWMKPKQLVQETHIKKELTRKSFVSKAGVEVCESLTKSEKKWTYCQRFYEIAEYCENLLNRAEKNTLVLGLDLDWPVAYKSVFKIEQIHICSGENECAIFNVSKLVNTVPRALTLLLNHCNIKLVGFNIRKDLTKLGKNFSFQVDDIISKLEDPQEFAEEKLSCFHKWSIKSVAKEGLDPFEEVKPEPQIEQLKFPGLINYTKTVNDCGAVCEKLLKIAKSFPDGHNLVFGFDVEWPFTFKGPGNGKVALIQMCPEESVCFLFHVASFKSLPKSLVLLLKHPRVKLTGLNIANDIRKIGRDFRIEVTDIIQERIIELCTLANTKLKTSHRWSLGGLVLNQLNAVLEKPKNVRISNWAADPLKKEQVIYAASDAYASLAVYNHLMETESSPPTLQFQNRLAEMVKGNNFPFSGGALLLLEHTPVYTVGLRRREYGPEYEENLKKLGAEFIYTNRGGLVTFHGPGQLVAYPVLNLKMFKASMRWYVESLEEVVIKLCKEYSLSCERSPHTGVWVGNNKLCAIGVHGSKFVTTHGLALNCSTDMSWFQHIVPCGIEGKGVTSLSIELNCSMSPNDVIPNFLKCFQDHFRCQLHEGEDTKLLEINE